MKEKQSWDGRSKTSSLGMWIFMKIISFLGLLPAYILLAFITINYTVFHTDIKKQLKAFRSKLGLTTNIWNVYKHIFKGFCPASFSGTWNIGLNLSS